MSGVLYQTDGRALAPPSEKGAAAHMYDRMAQGLLACMDAPPVDGAVDVQVEYVDPGVPAAVVGVFLPLRVEEGVDAARAARSRVHQEMSQHDADMLSSLFTDWHVVTQDRMFAHLSSLWREDVPRVMIDAGCHAGHGRHKNVSDALLWLDKFHSDRSEVLAIDAFEDFALDLQRRFDHHPRYSSYTKVRKRAIAVALAPHSGKLVNLRGMARTHITCCADKWCNHERLERLGSDHLCKGTRMRLGIVPSDGRDLRTRYPANLTSRIPNGADAKYEVPTQRLDDVGNRCCEGSTSTF